MKCPNCGTVFDSKFCPTCGLNADEAVKISLEKELSKDSIEKSTTEYADKHENTAAGQQTEAPSSISQETNETNQNQIVQKQIKKIDKRLIFEIAGGILIAAITLFLFGGVSQEKYDALFERYRNSQNRLAEALNTYETYQEKMSKFEALSDEEFEALSAEVDAKLEEQRAAEEQAAAEDAARQQAIASATTEQINALNSANAYLNTMPFSYTGLIEQLEYEGYSNEAATYAADNCGADWNEQAALTAQSYIDLMSFSRSGLIEQLVYEGYTQEQAEYGASAVGY